MGFRSTDSHTDPLSGANHLTSIRWGLASAVALGHIWLLTTGYEPFRIYRWTASWMAVNGFFVLSGMLIAKSLDLRGDIKSYAKSRILRIYPALIAVMLSFVFVFAPLFSEQGGFARMIDPDVWAYASKVLVLGNPENAPGPVFAHSLAPDFDGPLWTIRFELAAYALAGLAYVIGASKGLMRTLVLYGVVQTIYLVAPHFIDFDSLPQSLLPFLRLSSAFLMGMVLWQWPEARRPPWWLVGGLIAAFLALGWSPVSELLGTLALAAIMMRLGLSERKIRPLIKLPDYSYGIYIWHFPVMQIILYFWPDMNPYLLGLVSVPLFICLAALSWHLIEKPALKLKKGWARKSATV